MKPTLANLAACIAGGVVVALLAMGLPAAPTQEGDLSWPTP